jgi:hypothetical protein
LKNNKKKSDRVISELGRYANGRWKGTPSNREMCEFCSYGPNSTSNRDHLNPSFAGFFSAAAIEDAVRRAKQSNAKEDNDDGEDSDGT